MPTSPSSPKSETLRQIDKFVESARALECDEDEKAFEEKVRAIARRRPPGDWSVRELKDGSGYYPHLNPSTYAASENGPIFGTEAEAWAWVELQKSLADGR